MDSGRRQAAGRRTRRRATALLGLAVVAGYLGSALVLAGPKTPITFALYPAVASYMHPHFPQNWNLFAPDPVNEERGVLARFECTSGATTEWVNVTERGVQSVQRSRLFPSRESRIVSNGMIMRFREDDVLARVDERRTGSGDPGPATDAVLDPLREAVAKDQADVERLLARYALVRAGSSCPKAGVEQVQLRYVFHAFPGWSGRDDLEAVGEVSTVDSAWVTP